MNVPINYKRTKTHELIEQWSKVKRLKRGLILLTPGDRTKIDLVMMT